MRRRMSGAHVEDTRLPYMWEDASRLGGGPRRGRTPLAHMQGARASSAYRRVPAPRRRRLRKCHFLSPSCLARGNNRHYRRRARGGSLYPGEGSTPLCLKSSNKTIPLAVFYSAVQALTRFSRGPGPLIWGPFIVISSTRTAATAEHATSIVDRICRFTNARSYSREHHFPQVSHW